MLDDPAWTSMNVDRPRHKGHDPFWFELLNTPRGVRARCVLVRRPPPEKDQSDVEMRQFLDLGPALVGQQSICHGGFLATVMDEAGGILVQACGLDGGLPPFTVTLNMTYHKPVPAPGVVLVTGKVIARDRRKTKLLTTIVDDGGATCVSAEVLFVRNKQSL